MPDIKKYLNRDGLAEYNSLLPHSSAEMQTYVNDWLDEHPEATTTVQDGAITEPKLADKSVSLRTLADDTMHMLKGAILTGNLSGNVLTADDAYSAPPVALIVEGKSTQDGTPTPESPVPIQSIEVLELPVTFSGKNLFDKVRVGNHSNWDTSRTYAYIAIAVPPNTPITAHYNHAAFSISNCYLHMSSSYGASAPSTQYLIANSATNARNTVHATSTASGNIYLNMYGKSAETLQKIMDAIGDILQIEVGDTASEYVPFIAPPITANIPMQGHVLRSLPDGTKDTLTLTYLRPSTREGWAWYSRELVQAVDTLDLGAQSWSRISSNSMLLQTARISTMPNISARTVVMCDVYAARNSASELEDKQIKAQNNYNCIWVRDDAYNELTPADFKASLNGVTAIYPLAAPVTTQLDPIELPVLPAPDVTVWADPTTGLQMEYVRNSNLVIQRIEEAIADQ